MSIPMDLLPLVAIVFALLVSLEIGYRRWADQREEKES